MSTVTKQALRVYVALSNLGERGGDVLDALIPFFEPILKELDRAIFDPSVFAAGVRKLYNWRFTTDVAREFIPKLARKGYLKQIGRTSGYTVDYTPPANLENAAPEALQVISEILNIFETYPSKLTDLFHFSRTREELEDILIRFLVSLNAYDADFFRVQVARLHEQNAAKPEGLSLEEGGRLLTSEERYLCARFLKDIVASHQEYVPYLTRLASIGLLTEVVEDFVKPTSVADASDLIIFLDAPMALHYLGLSGKAIQADVKNVLDSLKAIGCNLMMFPESCEEMARNLSSMLSLAAPNRRGYTHDAMRRGEVNEKFVIAVRNDPEKAVESVGISIRNYGLAMYPHLHPFFPADAYEDFLSTITWVKEVEPREHDAKCATYIMRLREGRASSDLFKCRYVFATNNPKFARQSRAYARSAQIVKERQWGPVVHLVDLATLAWLRTGLHQSEIIPRGRLVGVCERVLMLRPEVTKAVYEKLSEVVTPEKLVEYELLLSDQRSVQMLMDQTVGNSAVVTTENVQHLFEQMRLATVEDVTTRFNEKLAVQATRYLEVNHLIESERSAERAAFRTELSAQARELEEAQTRALETEERLKGEAVSLNRRLDAAYQDESERFLAVIEQNNIVFGWLKIVLLVLLVGLVCTSVFGAGFAFIEKVAHSHLVIGSILIVGVLSGYALWAALMNRPIDVVRFALDWMARQLLYVRGRTRMPEARLVREMEAAQFSNGTVTWRAGARPAE